MLFVTVGEIIIEARSGPALGLRVAGSSDLIGLLIYIEITAHVMGAIDRMRLSLFLHFISLSFPTVEV